MTDPLKGRYHLIFKQEFEKAKERLSFLNGTLELGVHNYQAFIFKTKGLQLVFYPHKTKSTGNVHIRVRTQGVINKTVLKKAIFALAENSCTFQYPADIELHQKAVLEFIKNERVKLNKGE